MSDQAAYRRLMARTDQFHVWVDPRNPGVAVLEREFGWFRALVIFGIAMLVMIPVYNIVGAPRPLAYERRVRADPGSWFVSCAVALQWNLMAIPIVSVALVVTAHFFVYVFAAFLLAVLGAGLAILAWDALRKQWGLGALTIEILGNGSTPSTLRVRFSRPFGSGCDPAQFSPHVQCELRQVEYYRVTKQRSWKVTWSSPLEQREVRHGAVTVDFTFSPPPWTPTESWEHGYWDVELSALNVVVGFKLPP